MNWKQYQNELIVLASLVIMIFAYVYKNNQATAQAQASQGVHKTLEEVKEAVALKQIWKNKQTTKRLEKLQHSINSSKVQWNKKGKKVTATFKGLNNMELNKLSTQILNLAVEITLLDIKKVGSIYNVEFKCKY